MTPSEDIAEMSSDSEFVLKFIFCKKGKERVEKLDIFFPTMMSRTGERRRGATGANGI